MALLISLRNNLKSMGTSFNVRKQSFSIFQALVKQVKNRPVLRYDPQKRTFFSIFRTTTKQEWKVKDDIQEGFELIYRNPTDKFILIAQTLTTVSTIIVCIIAFYADFKKNHELPYSPENVFNHKPRQVDNEILIFVTFFIVTLVLFQYFIRQMPQRIYYHTQLQKYWLVFHGNIPFTIKKMPLKMGEVRPAPGGLTPWREHRYEIKDGNKVILIDSYFGRPADLYIMMGVQRDPNFEDDGKI